MTCYHNPGQAGTPPSAPQRLAVADLGWDSGAETSLALDGDLHLVFNMSVASVGVVGGIKPGRGAIGSPALLTHAFAFQRSNAGSQIWFVMESGVAKTPQNARAVGLDETFEVRRSGGVVRYFVTQSGGLPVLVYTSASRSAGVVTASPCLYASGDTFG